VGVRSGVEFVRFEGEFESEEVEARLRWRDELVLILGLVEGGVGFDGPGDGDGFSVGNVNVGKMSDVDADVGTVVSVVVKKVASYGDTCETGVGIGDTVPDPLDRDRNRGGLR
jgi:hypothetical protein